MNDEFGKGLIYRLYLEKIGRDMPGVLWIADMTTREII